MQLNILTLTAVLLLSLVAPSMAQEKKQAVMQSTQSYPETFSISQQDLDVLLGSKHDARLSFPENIYLDNGTIELNTVNGDMHFVNYKLRFFRNSRLIVLKNGSHSTQVYITSDDKSVFYKGTFSGSMVKLTKCEEDEIVSE